MSLFAQLCGYLHASPVPSTPTASAVIEYCLLCGASKRHAQAPRTRTPAQNPRRRENSPGTLESAGPRTEAGVAEDREGGNRNSVAKDHTSQAQAELEETREERGASVMARTPQGEEKTETPGEVRLLCRVLFGRVRCSSQKPAYALVYSILRSKCGRSGLRLLAGSHSGR